MHRWSGLFGVIAALKTRAGPSPLKKDEVKPACPSPFGHPSPEMLRWAKTRTNWSSLRCEHRGRTTPAATLVDECIESLVSLVFRLSQMAEGELDDAMRDTIRDAIREAELTVDYGSISEDEREQLRLGIEQLRRALCRVDT